MTKINDILPHWPKGTVKTVKELTSLGLYPSLLQGYTRTKWIELFIKGMYKQYSDEVTWQGLLYGLQKNKESAIHAGGKTALELKGYSHYLGMGGSKVFIFSNRNLNFNLGLKKFPNITLKRTEIFDYIQETYFTYYDAGGYKIIISAENVLIKKRIPQKKWLIYFAPPPKIQGRSEDLFMFYFNSIILRSCV